MSAKSARCGQGEPREVEGPVERAIARLRHEQQRGDDACRTERHVDVEDPVPVDRLDQRSADERPEREPDRRDADPDPDRRRPFPGMERRRDDRERGGQDERRSEALQRAGRDQQAAAHGEGAGERADGEDDEAEHEDPAAPEDVRELAGRKQQHGERERIGVDGPLELGEPDPELCLDRRQRDVHDRQVDVDHEQREREHRQRPPAPAALEDRYRRSEIAHSARLTFAARRRQSVILARAVFVRDYMARHTQSVEPRPPPRRRPARARSRRLSSRSRPLARKPGPRSWPATPCSGSATASRATAWGTRSRGCS